MLALVLAAGLLATSDAQFEPLNNNMVFDIGEQHGTVLLRGSCDIKTWPEHGSQVHRANR
jgi:hypothetical protein